MRWMRVFESCCPESSRSSERDKKVWQMHVWYTLRSPTLIKIGRWNDWLLIQARLFLFICQTKLPCYLKLQTVGIVTSWYQLPEVFHNNFDLSADIMTWPYLRTNKVIGEVNSKLTFKWHVKGFYGYVKCKNVEIREVMRTFLKMCCSRQH